MYTPVSSEQFFILETSRSFYEQEAFFYVKIYNLFKHNSVTLFVKWHDCCKKEKRKLNKKKR